MDAITRHRLQQLGIDGAELESRSLEERTDWIHQAFLERLPYENLSDNQSCTAVPDDPEAWPRTTDRVLRENRTLGLGGTSFALSYALRDIFRGAGANAHCTLGYNLVTEQAHAAVVVYHAEEPVLYDPSLLILGAVPVRPDGAFEDPLGTVAFRPRSGATLTLTIRMRCSARERRVYSIIPIPALPQAFRQAWVASFYRGRVRPLRLARRVGNEIVRYGERPGTLDLLRASGTEQRALGGCPVDELHHHFGIRRDLLARWFEGRERVA